MDKMMIAPIVDGERFILVDDERPVGTHNAGNCEVCAARYEYETAGGVAPTGHARADLTRATAAAKWDKNGLKEACQRGLKMGRSRQEFDIQLLLDALLEIERLESSRATGETTVEAALKELREMLERALREGRHGPMCDRARCVCWKADTRARLKAMAQVRTTRREGEGSDAK